MAKIKKITVSNLKAVSRLTADFNGCTAIITGGNNKGKTTFLKSLPDRIRGIKPDVVVKKGEDDGFAEWELTTGEKFVWSFDVKTKAGEKLNFITEKNIKTSVTKDLANAYFPNVFDVDDFLSAAPAKQKAILQKISGVDFTEFDKVYKEAYEERTFRNKQLKIEQAKAEWVDPKLQKEPIPTDELEKELAGIEVHNKEYSRIQQGITDRQKSIKENDEEIEDLEKKIKSLNDKNQGLVEEITKANTWSSVEKNKPITEDQKEKKEKELQEIKDLNVEIVKNNKSREQEKVIEQSQQFAKDAEEEVKRLEQEKEEVVKNSTLPDGFGFSEDGITYKGYAFTKEQLSSSGIYIAALKLAAIGLGEVKMLHFDASFLDKNSLSEVEKWANDNDLQLLIERPDFDGGEIEYQLIDHTSKLAVA